MNCKNCGYSIQETYHFCGNCGEKIIKNDLAKEESKDNFIDREGKGSSIRKRRKMAAILYLVVAFWNFGVIIFTILTTSITITDSDISKQFPPLFIVFTLFLVINLLIGRKDNLEEIRPWYKSK
jgi:uncharacterized membrane protein YvbJ